MISEGARGGTVGFLRVKIDDVTKEDVVIWGFEPMRDGLAISCTDAKVMYYFLRAIWQTQRHKSFFGLSISILCSGEFIRYLLCSI